MMRKKMMTMTHQAVSIAAKDKGDPLIIKKRKKRIIIKDTMMKTTTWNV
jgi:hypothetical protein